MTGTVRLLRNIIEDRSLSMARYADELERHVPSVSRWKVHPLTIHPTALKRVPGMRRADNAVARFVRYPLSAARASADVYHIADHSSAHVSQFLPKHRTVVTCHDLIPLVAHMRNEAFGLPAVFRARFRWSVRYLGKVAALITPTAATKADVTALLGIPEERIAIVPHGIDGQFFNTSPYDRSSHRNELGIRSRYVVLHVSTGGAYKNNSGVIRVVGELRRAGLDVSLVRVGRPLAAAEWQRCKREGIEAFVLDRGYVEQPELVRTYRLSDVLLFPSLYEGFGWPVLEAMACGTPVVASNCPALIEVAGLAAVTAAPRDIRGLTAAVRMVLQNGDVRQRLETAGRARASAMTWERAARKTTRVYEQVMGNNVGRTGV